MAREPGRDRALSDTFGLLRMRVENAKLRTAACVADSAAVMERIRRTHAARAGGHTSKDMTELVADATRAFAEHGLVRQANLNEIRRHLERIRAHGDAIAALYGRFHSAKRNC